MQLFYRIAADCVVTCHMAYAMVVVLGLPITIGGIVRKSPWARNFWWRSIHLGMILIVVLESAVGMACPLTIWERDLRILAEQQTYQGAFIANLIHNCLFYDVPPWVLMLVYATFGLLVLITFIIAPPRWPWARKNELGPS